MAFPCIPTATHMDTIADIGSNTNRRDVSEMLDLWAHRNTPFLNRLSWGPDSGGLAIEWISEHLGYGYVEIGSNVGSAGTSILVSVSGLASAGMAVKQLNTGALLFGYDSTDSTIALINVSGICGDNTIIINQVVPSSSSDLSLVGGEFLYIVGNPVNEGSSPREDRARIRDQRTNNFTILRKDVRITGSMQATDMYAVDNELRHQISMRLLEMQREREMTILLSITQARAAGTVGYINGLYGFLEDQTGNHILQTSQDFTESSVNDVAAELYDNGSTPDILVGATTQIRKFTTWDRARVRTAPDKHLGGFHVTKYLTDTGIELDLIPMRKFPSNMAFMVDSSQIHPRAKKGRKLIIEKLGVTGDFVDYQILSEFSLEVRHYDQGYHGMWSKLNG